MRRASEWIEAPKPSRPRSSGRTASGRHAFPGSRDRAFAVARMPGGLPQATVAPVRQLDSKEDTMRTNHRTAPALTAPWLIAAAAALATLAAAIFLLNPPKTQAAGTAGTVVSTAK